MTKNQVALWLCAAAASVWLTGCCCAGGGTIEPGVTVSPVMNIPPSTTPIQPITSPAVEVVMVDQPCPPCVEVLDVGQNDARVWVSGSWVRSGQRWIWLPARQEIWERPGAAAERNVWGGAEEY